MQYYRPGGIYFAGDAMPFFHDGLFHLFYLLDEGHHQALDGLGGHQWAHATTRDLIHWDHHPLALAITSEEEGSICTGSVYFHEGVYYAFYATRTRTRTQHLSFATSTDGIHFTKRQPNPLALPGPGYSPYHYRDPFLLCDERGQFHLLITAQRDDHPLAGRGGCLAHLVSADLEHWQTQEPLLYPGYGDPPECPDHFFWNGWYYLLFSNSLVARYRMARQPLGPWLRPPVDALDSSLARVMKSAAFTGNRRIGVAWLGSRAEDRDDGRPLWGGHLLFRELVQFPDGTLGSKFPAEMIPPAGEPVPLDFTLLAGAGRGEAGRITLKALLGLTVGAVTGVAHNAYIRLQVRPQAGVGQFGLRLRGVGAFEGGYDLAFLPLERMVRLGSETIHAVDGLDQPFTVEIVLHDEIIDVCIDGRCCIVNRCPERRGDRLFFFAQDTGVVFEQVEVRPLVHQS
jgi:beta-fructofuranosidase